MIRMQSERLFGSTALPAIGNPVDFFATSSRLPFRAAVRDRFAIRPKRKS